MLARCNMVSNVITRPEKEDPQISVNYEGNAESGGQKSNCMSHVLHDSRLFQQYYFIHVNSFMPTSSQVCRWNQKKSRATQMLLATIITTAFRQPFPTDSHIDFFAVWKMYCTMTPLYHIKISHTFKDLCTYECVMHVCVHAFILYAVRYVINFDLHLQNGSISEVLSGLRLSAISPLQIKLKNNMALSEYAYL